MTGQEHDGKDAVHLLEPVLQFKPVQARHAHVEQDAAGCIAGGVREELLPRFIERDLIA